MTLDGFTAAPGVSTAHPFGIGGERVQEWLFGPAEESAAELFNPGYGTEGAADAAADEIDRSAAARMFETTGAFVLGRRTFDVSELPWGGDNAFAGALELVVGRVEHLEAPADELLALGAEHREQLPVAVDHQPVARQHEADRR